MDFFAEQARARRQTRRMVAALVGGMMALGVGVGWVINAVMPFEQASANGTAAELNPAAWWVAGSFMTVTLVASAWRYHQLKKAGGGGVARDLGGRLLMRPVTDPQHQQLLNIVDEMAIASGMPPPDVYLLPSATINAFAAGFEPMDAVIGITQGALGQLNRAELQAVVAHEFSHILHGDVRLNSCFTGLAYGLTAIAVIGRRGLVRRRSRERGQGLMVSVFLVVIGSIGAGFARWVQAGVSRQREFLADATAAQLTRNPQGLAEALNRVRWHRLQVDSDLPDVSEHRHIFFSDPE